MAPQENRPQLISPDSASEAPSSDVQVDFSRMHDAKDISPIPSSVRKIAQVSTAVGSLTAAGMVAVPPSVAQGAELSSDSAHTLNLSAAELQKMRPKVDGMSIAMPSISVRQDEEEASATEDKPEQKPTVEPTPGLEAPALAAPNLAVEAAPSIAPKGAFAGFSESLLNDGGNVGWKIEEDGNKMRFWERGGSAQNVLVATKAGSEGGDIAVAVNAQFGPGSNKDSVLGVGFLYDEDIQGVRLSVFPNGTVVVHRTYIVSRGPNGPDYTTAILSHRPEEDKKMHIGEGPYNLFLAKQGDKFLVRAQGSTSTWSTTIDIGRSNEILAGLGAPLLPSGGKVALTAVRPTHQEVSGEFTDFQVATSGR